jgi:hypothetical protein
MRKHSNKIYHIVILNIIIFNFFYTITNLVFIIITKEELPASILVEIEYFSIKNLKNIVSCFARKRELYEILKKTDIKNCITMKDKIYIKK